MVRFILFLGILFICMPAYAVEFTRGDFKAKVFGELYTDIFYTYSNRDGNGIHSIDEYAFSGSSAFGVELSYGSISGTFEAGLTDNVRKFFLTYNFSNYHNHFIQIGKNETVAWYTFGEVSHNLGGLCDFGTLNDAAKRLQVRYGIKGFELLVIIPSLGNTWNPEFSDDYGYKLGNEQFQPFYTIPRIEAAYTYQTENILLKAYGSYAAYLYEDISNIAQDKYFHSYLLGLGGQVNFGTSFLQFTMWYGSNLDLTDSLTNYKHRFIKAVDGKISMFLEDGSMAENIYSFGTAIGMGHTFYDRFTPQFGVGYSFNYGDSYSKIDDSFGAYINFVIRINDWLSITPEVAYMDYMYDSFGNREGYDIIAGAVASLIF